MKLKMITSYAALEEAISGTEKSFLLLYKKGTPQSECALERFTRVVIQTGEKAFSADVNEVRDIHQKLQVTTAPSLVVFKRGKVANIIKGCQTEPAYRSIISGRELGSVREAGAKKPRQVTLYTTPTCSWCTTLKTYLKEQQVSYREINVAADSAAAEMMVRKSGQQGVPQTEINGQMVVGFDKARINQLLEIS